MAVISLYVIRNLFSINGFLSSLEQFFFLKALTMWTLGKSIRKASDNQNMSISSVIRIAHSLISFTFMKVKFSEIEF